jgi:hypothetical protein
MAKWPAPGNTIEANTPQDRRPITRSAYTIVGRHGSTSHAAGTIGDNDGAASDAREPCCVIVVFLVPRLGSGLQPAFVGSIARTVPIDDPWCLVDVRAGR